MYLSRPFQRFVRRSSTWSAFAEGPKATIVRPLSAKPSVTLADLASSVAEEHDLSKAESKRILVSLFDQMTEVSKDCVIWNAGM